MIRCTNCGNVSRYRDGHACGSPRRWRILGGPGGYVSIVRAGDPLNSRDYMKSWQELARFSLPRRTIGAPAPLPVAIRQAALGWTLRAFPDA